MLLSYRAQETFVSLSYWVLNSMTSFVSRCRKQLMNTRLISVPDTVDLYFTFSGATGVTLMFSPENHNDETRGKSMGWARSHFSYSTEKRPSSNDGSGWKCHVLMDGLKYRNCSVICVQFDREPHQEMIPKKTTNAAVANAKENKFSWHLQKAAPVPS